MLAAAVIGVSASTPTIQKGQPHSRLIDVRIFQSKATCSKPANGTIGLV